VKFLMCSIVTKKLQKECGCYDVVVTKIELCMWCSTSNDGEDPCDDCGHLYTIGDHLTPILCSKHKEESTLLHQQFPLARDRWRARGVID